MSFKPKWILLKTFFESQFQVIYVYEFQTKANSYEDICLVSFWSDVSLWIWNQSEFSWRHLLSLSFKLCKLMSLKQSDFWWRLCWVGVWSYLCLWVSNKSEFLWRHLLSLILKLWKFMSLKQERILMMTFFESQFEVL